MVAICDWVRSPHHAEVIAPLNILSLTSSDVYKQDEGGGCGRGEYSPSGPGVSSLLIVYVLKKSLS